MLARTRARGAEPWAAVETALRPGLQSGCRAGGSRPSHQGQTDGCAHAPGSRIHNGPQVETARAQRRTMDTHVVQPHDKTPCNRRRKIPERAAT